MLATDPMPSGQKGSGNWFHRQSLRLRAIADSARVPFTVGVSLTVFGLQAIHSILLARLLGPEGRGEYGTAIFYAQTLIYIGLLGTHYSIARRAAQWHLSDSEQDFSPLQRSAFRSGLITGTLSLMVAAGLSWVGLPAGKDHLLPLCWICALLLPAEHLRLTAQAVDHGRGSFNRYNLSRLAAAAVFPVLVAIYYFADLRNLTLIAWTTVAVSVAGYTFYWLISDTRQVLKPSRPSARALIREGIPDGRLVFVNDLFDRLAMLLVVWIVSLADQGLFLTAMPIASLLLVAPNALELFAFRAAVNSEKRMKRAQFWRALPLILLCQTVVFVGLQVCLTPIVTLLLTDSFIDAIPVARVLILSMSLSGMTIVAEGYLRGRELTRTAIISRVFSIVILLGSVLLLPHDSELMRVAWAAVIGHAANALLVGMFVYRDVLHHEVDE